MQYAGPLVKPKDITVNAIFGMSNSLIFNW
jgi:hypothetical protein